MKRENKMKSTVNDLDKHVVSILYDITLLQNLLFLSLISCDQYCDHTI